MARDEFQVNKELTLANALNFIVGEQLSSVEFVQDYVQFRFDGLCITVYTNAHTVTKNGIALGWGESGYRDTLCELIGQKVTKTSILEDESLSLEFDNRSIWTASLRDVDQRGPEALIFNDEQRKVWFVL